MQSPTTIVHQIDLDRNVEIKELCNGSPFLIFIFQLTSLSYIYHRYFRKDTFHIKCVSTKIFPADSGHEVIVPIAIGRDDTFKELFTNNKENVLQRLDADPSMTSNKIDFHVTDNFGVSNRAGITFCLDLDRRVEVHSTQELTNEFSGPGSILAHFNAFLNDLIPNKLKAPLSSVNIFPKTSLDHNTTYFDLDIGSISEDSVIDLLHKPVMEKPDAVAISDGDHTLTFNKFWEATGHVADYLIAEQKVREQELIGVIAHSDCSIIIAMIGVWKAGAVYVPIAHEVSQSQVKSIIQDTGIQCLLCPHEMVGHYAGIANEVLDIKTLINHVPERPFDRCKLGLGQLACISYDFDIHDDPKGIMINHSLVHQVITRSNMASFTNHTSFLLPYPTTMTSALFTALSVLVEGAQLVLLSDDLSDTRNVLASIEREHVTHASFTPTMFSEILWHAEQKNYLPLARLNTLFCEGEALMFQPVMKWINSPNSNCRVFYLHGNTATGGANFAHQVSLEDSKERILGFPFQSTDYLLLDEWSRKVPHGAEGELHIHTDYMSKGYINAREDTALKFHDVDHRRYYRTGVTVRLDRDGRLIQTHGLASSLQHGRERHELNDIKNTLLQKEGVKNVATVIDDSTKQPRLLVFMVLSASIEDGAFNRLLSERLPPIYQLAFEIIEVEAIPLDNYGKANNEKLLRFGNGSRVKDRWANENQKIVIDTWREVSGFGGSMSPMSDFFKTGGDSIQAIQLSSKFHQKGYPVQVRDILRNRLVYQQATLLKNETAKYPTISQKAYSGDYVLSPVQRWFFSLPSDQLHHYNHSVFFGINDLNVPIFKAAVKALHQHHDVLRSVFYQENRTWKGRIVVSSDIEPRIDLVDVSNLDLEQIETLKENAQRSFDLRNGPLTRMLVLGNKGYFKILFIIHHLLVDGVSWRVLFEDLSALYQAGLNQKQPALPPKTHAFPIWTEHLQGVVASNELQSKRAFWHDFKPSDPVQEIRGKVSNEATTLLHITLSSEQTQKLIVRYDRVDVLVLTAFLRRFTALTGRSVLSVMMESHGRSLFNEEFNLNRTVGWFTTFYPIHLVQREKDFAKQYDAVSTELDRMAEFGDYYLMLKYLTQEGLNRPEPQISFNYLGKFDGDLRKSVFDFPDDFRGKEISDSIPALCSLNLSAIIEEEQLSVSFSFQKENFDVDKAQRLLDEMLQDLSEGTLYETPLRISDIPHESGVIDAIEDQQYYETSPAQKRLWMLSQSEGKMAAFNMARSYHLTGILDVEKLKEAILKVIQRHEALRSVYFIHDGGLKQKVLSDDAIDFHEVSLGEQTLEDLLRQHEGMIFDLEKGPMFSVWVIRKSSTEHNLSICLPHINGDRWSLNLVLNEIYTLYSYPDLGLERPELQYKNFAVYHNNLLQREAENRLKTYWNKKLLNARKLALPVKNGSHNKELRGSEFQFELGNTHFEQLNHISELNGVSNYVVCLAVIKILIARWTGQDDIIIGSPFSGRDFKELNDQVGLYLHTLPLRTHVQEDASVQDIINKVSDTFLEAVEHQYYPYELIVNELDLDIEKGKDPLFEVGLTWLNTNEQLINDKTDLSGVSIVPVDLKVTMIKHLLWFYITQSDVGLTFSIQYDNQSFDQETINKLKDSFIKCLEIIYFQESITIGDLSKQIPIQRYSNEAQMLIATERILDDF